MTKVKKGIMLALACTLVIATITGITVILVRNNTFSKSHQNTSSETIQNVNQSRIGADNKNLSTFKNFSELVAALKAKGYFSQNTNSIGRQYTNAEIAMEEDQSISTGSASKSNMDTMTTSETNTQVSGVDEGDLVKTDGNYIYALANNVVRIIDPKNPVEMRLVSSVTLDFNNSSAVEMYIYQDKLIIIGYYYEQAAKSNDVETKEYFNPENYGTCVKVYSLTDVNKPVLFREFKVQGNLSSSRLIEEKLYLITSKSIYYYGDEKNITPQNILPQYYDSASTEKSFVTISENGVNYCNISELNSFLNIASFDINDTKDANIETILGGSGTVYMTKENLYVAYGVYEPVKTLPAGTAPSITADIAIARIGSENNVILKFSVNGLSVKYSASAKVSGNLLNQFSLDEYNGFLRVATTSYSDNTTQNNLYIYDNELKETGKLTGLAKGERIYSVRYSGNTGYIVTFRQTDPLFVIDLSNTSAPKVLGELKIPGFSNYMHVVGENLVLGIGRDTKETEVLIEEDMKSVAPEMAASSGNSAAGSFSSVEPSASTRTVVKTGGIKLSLFDVSDKANPKELDTVVIGDSSAYCEAQYNHKALVFDNKEKKLYLPFHFVSSDLKSSKIYTGSVIAVSEKELKEEHYFQTESLVNKNNYDYGYNASRFSYIGNNLFLIASDNITSYHKSTFEKLGTINF